MNSMLIAVGLAMILVSPAAAQTTPGGGKFSGLVKISWDNIKKNVAESATDMPENEYGFKPTPQVRTFGQIVGHLINEHYLMCSAAKGEKSPIGDKDFEKVTAKAELVKALNESIAYCDQAYAGMTDAKAFEPVKMFDQEYSRLGALVLNVTHDSEHYGNFITYMRIKGLTPPSSKRTSQ